MNEDDSGNCFILLQCVIFNEVHVCPIGFLINTKSDILADEKFLICKGPHEL